MSIDTYKAISLALYWLFTALAIVTFIGFLLGHWHMLILMIICLTMRYLLKNDAYGKTRKN